MQVRTLSSLELLGLASTANTTSKPSEGNDLLVFGNVAEIRVCLGQFETYTEPPKTSSFNTPCYTDHCDKRTSKSGGHLTHVLEVGAEVLSAGPRSCTTIQTRLISLQRREHNIGGKFALFSGLVATAAAA